MDMRTTEAAGATGGNEIRRALSRLTQKGVVAVPVADESGGADLIGAGGHSRLTLAAHVWAALVEGGLVMADGGGERWVITPSGRVELKRLISRGGETAAASPVRPEARARAPKALPPRAEQPGFDAAECPVAWLAKRRDKTGEPLISAEQLAAADRLRSDFWFAGMTPRVTTNWSAALGGGGGTRSAPGAGVEIRDAVVAAGERVRRALAAVGPDLAGILIDVCCHLKRLEAVERAAHWPQRSAKIVLGIALTILVRHYGIGKGAGSAPSGAAAIRHWGSMDFRPSVDGGTNGEVCDERVGS